LAGIQAVERRKPEKNRPEDFKRFAAGPPIYALAARAAIVYIVHNVCSDIRFYKQEAS
jgi:hypothetical protein